MEKGNYIRKNVVLVTQGKGIGDGY
jgi:hypothetical protein